MCVSISDYSHVKLLWDFTFWKNHLKFTFTWRDIPYITTSLSLKNYIVSLYVICCTFIWNVWWRRYASASEFVGKEIVLLKVSSPNKMAPKYTSLSSWVIILITYENLYSRSPLYTQASLLSGFWGFNATLLHTLLVQPTLT